MFRQAQGATTRIRLRRPPGRGCSLEDHYLSLVARLRTGHNGQARGPQSIGITASKRGEGVTTIATNLAVSAAQRAAQPVLLIDADRERPEAERIFGLDFAPGFTEALSGAAEPMECVQQTGVRSLWVMTAGALDNFPSCDRASATGLISQLKQRFGLIVVDLPPVTESSAGFLLAGVLDGVVLILECERTRVQQAQRAKEQLVHANANLLGIVFNKQSKSVSKWLK